MKRFALNLLLSGVVLVLLTQSIGCSTVPVTGRKQFNFMSQGEETQLGFSEFGKMKQQLPINRDPKINELVQRVGKRIAAVATPDMPNASWEFVVFESKEANAFCLPGGKVGVYTGILPITQTDDGLATVMGHEVAHAVARHGGERMSQATGLNVLGTALGVATGSSQYGPLLTQAYGLTANIGIAQPLSRQNESEADHIGLIYMARAGYAPEQAVDFWKRFGAYNQQQGQATPWFLRTHPLDAQRVANLQALLPAARAEFHPAPK